METYRGTGDGSPIRVPRTVRCSAYEIACGLACHWRLADHAGPTLRTTSSSVRMRSAKPKLSMIAASSSTSEQKDGTFSWIQRAKVDASNGMVGMKACCQLCPGFAQLTSICTMDFVRSNSERWLGSASSCGRLMIVLRVSWSSFSSDGSPSPESQSRSNDRLTLVVQHFAQCMKQVQRLLLPGDGIEAEVSSAHLRE